MDKITEKQQHTIGCQSDNTIVFDASNAVGQVTLSFKR